MNELRDGDVALRPYREDDLETLVAARSPGRPEREYRELMRRRVERSGSLVEGRLDLGVEHAGRLVGSIEARQPREGLPPGAFEIGIGLFDEADRRRGLGTTSIRLLTDYLFRGLRAERVQASTAVGNAAMRRVLEKVGFRCEGVMRAFMPRPDGGRDDYALYAVTRDEWRARSAR